MAQKVLVTGGTGFIGSHTVVELQESGYEVIIADNLSNSEFSVLANIQKITGIKPIFYQIDVCDKESLEQLFEENQDIEAVIHFAAFKAVGESMQMPLKYYRNNVGSLVNLLETMQDYEVTNLVFSSSCTVYGDPDDLPVSESSPIKKAFSPYGNTKQICEEIISEAKNNAPLAAICLRYFNPIGAHPSALIGELPLGVPNNLVPFITQTAIGKREKLTVFGNDYSTPDGSCIRDYIHVVDLAKAHVIACKRLLSKQNNKQVEIFNLGTGKGSSVFEIVKTFEKISNTKLNYTIGARREGDVPAVFADTAFANTELGWKTELNLERMLEDAWRWEKHLNDLA